MLKGEAKSIICGKAHEYEDNAIQVCSEKWWLSDVHRILCVVNLPRSIAFGSLQWFPVVAVSFAFGLKDYLIARQSLRLSTAF